MNAVDHDNTINNTEESADKKTLGDTASVSFVTLGNQSVEGKVDTGATTSSLHADNIKINKNSNSVSFNCPEISNRVITMDLSGSQEVFSADAGGNTRPIVTFDIEVNGVPLSQVSFNLNDRSEMDSPILIGQNILKSGNFLVDVSKDEAPERVEAVQAKSILDRDAEVLEAVQLLANHNVTLKEILQYLRTDAINSIKN
jgi:hypothetical protein